MEIQLQDVFSAPQAKKSQLVQNEMAPQEVEYYEQQGWHHFRNDDLLRLPEISPALYYSHSHSVHGDRYVVVQVGQYRYKVRFIDRGGSDEPWDHVGKYLSLEFTEEPATPPDREPPDENKYRGGYYLKFFGQPTWVQNEHFPLDGRGNPCYHFLTIENEWGDMGNYNILVGLNEHGIPDCGYFEASCC